MPNNYLWDILQCLKENNLMKIQKKYWTKGWHQQNLFCSNNLMKTFLKTFKNYHKKKSQGLTSQKNKPKEDSNNTEL